MNAATGQTLDIEGYTTTITSTATFTGSGTIAISDTISPSGSGVDVSNVDLSNAYLSGPGTLTIPNGGNVTMTACQDGLESGIKLVNDGTLTDTTGCVVYLYDSSVLENAGTLVLGNGAEIVDESGTPQIINDASGTITAPSSTDYLVAPFADSGTVNAATGQTLDIEGYTTTITSTATFTGSGTIAISDTISPSGSGVDVSNVDLSNAYLSGPGTLTIPNGGNVTMTACQDGLESGIKLVNDGTLTDTTGCVVYLYDSSVLENAGTLVLGNGAEIVDESGTPQIINDASGTIEPRLRLLTTWLRRSPTPAV